MLASITEMHFNNEKNSLEIYLHDDANPKIYQITTDDVFIKIAFRLFCLLYQSFRLFYNHKRKMIERALRI
jgi:hypothetical protein